MSETKNFLKDTIKYSFGQIILLIFGAFQTLFIPIFLSVTEYGYWQYFLLFGAYVGLLHFGFNDGLLLHWAGKKLENIEGEIKSALLYLIIEQICIITIIGVILVVFVDKANVFFTLYCMLLLYALFVNLLTFFQYFLQSIKYFNYLIYVNVGKVLLFIVIMLIGFYYGYSTSKSVIISIIIAYASMALCLTIWVAKLLKGKSRFQHNFLKIGKNYTKQGFFVMIGNLVAVLFLTVDRQFVHHFFSIDDFAYYSFALRIVLTIYLFIQAISLVLFPYLAGTSEKNYVKIFQSFSRKIIIFWTFSLFLYFIMVLLIHMILPDYVNSISIFAILLCSISYGALVQILEINLFKLVKKQFQYFVFSFIALCIAVGLDYIVIVTWHTLESVAIVTVISYFVWSMINEIYLRKFLQLGYKELIYNYLIISIITIVFLIAVFASFTFIVKFMFFSIVVFLISVFFFNDDIKEIMRYLQPNEFI